MRTVLLAVALVALSGLTAASAAHGAEHLSLAPGLSFTDDSSDRFPIRGDHLDDAAAQLRPYRDGYLRVVDRGSCATEKLPMIADLDVFILIDYCANPIKVPSAAQFHLASSTRSLTAHQIDEGLLACSRLKG